MGILNLTPDSFSDGSRFATGDAANFQIDLDKVLAHAHSMVEAGASILDIGGESTRPGASAVSSEEEISRVIPALQRLKKEFDVCLSVDTSSPEVMKVAISEGASIINDVRALAVGDAMQVVAASNVGVCLMHMQGQPRTMQNDFHYENVVNEVWDFLSDRIAACNESGIDSERLLIDPGFGFGKSVDHNYELLGSLSELQSLQVPLLVGVSRKSMLGAVTGREVDQRLAASVAAATVALQAGARIIRSHDVAATMDAIRVNCAIENVG